MIRNWNENDQKSNVTWECKVNIFNLGFTINFEGQDYRGGYHRSIDISQYITIEWNHNIEWNNVNQNQINNITIILQSVIQNIWKSFGTLMLKKTKLSKVIPTTQQLETKMIRSTQNSFTLRWEDNDYVNGGQRLYN